MVNLTVSSLSSSNSLNWRARLALALAGIFLALAASMTFWSMGKAFSRDDGGGCFTPPKRDLAFIIDHSGSIASRGQTYNIEIAGVARALRDCSVIPRDGSTAVVIVVFDEHAKVRVASTDTTDPGHLKGIDSDEQAEKLARMVEDLTCDTTAAAGTCPSGSTNFDSAIKVANNFLIEHGRDSARRILLISTDGMPTDFDKGVSASKTARESAQLAGVMSELDVILVGLDPDIETVKLDARIVFPEPVQDLPGAILNISPGPCNEPGAKPEDLEDADCKRQVLEFAEHTRNVLRSDVPHLDLVVTTNEDGPVDAGLTLREAINLANCNGGNTTITFAAEMKGKVIMPLTPLPALTAPDIEICGHDNCEEKSCSPEVIIDGSRSDASIGEAHEDGILIRSNHDSICGVTIRNFKRAGIAVDPVIPSDCVGSNLIECNALENNPVAGVLILDPAPGIEHNVIHNVGNRISKNSIRGSVTPIDLGGDGPTPNDPADADEGPNTLLNFPLIDAIEQAGNTVTLTGRAVAGQLIEIFSIDSLPLVSGKHIIGDIEFLDEVIADSNGVFVVTGLPVSATRLYTATATDQAGNILMGRNTSELAPINKDCTEPAIAVVKLESSANTLKFNKGVSVKSFSIENTGCAPLVVGIESILRKRIRGGRANNDRDDSHLFSVALSAGGNVSNLTAGSFIGILPGSENIVTFLVSFNPMIPAVTGCTSRLSASDLLPNKFESLLNITLNGEKHTITLTGVVDTAVKLINPEPGQSGPLVSISRSGDVITVTFSVFDSNLDITTVDYKFTGADVNQPDRDLAKAIKQCRLVKGQSFTVEQIFTNASAKENRNVSFVEVTVRDKAGNVVQARSNSLSSATASSTIQPSRNNRHHSLVMPVIKLRPVSRKAE